MIAVITGDIVNSRGLPDVWINKLKDALAILERNGAKWEIFRGDSFQVEMKVEAALLQAIYLKACIKTLKKADVRIGIGIGKKDLDASRVGEANGEAFINSGMAFDTLKSTKINLSLKSPWLKLDEEINLLLRFASIIMDSWSQTSAEMVKYAIENKDLPQQKIAELSGRSQSSVSEALKRARFAEVIELTNRYQSEVSKLIKK